MSKVPTYNKMVVLYILLLPVEVPNFTPKSNSQKLSVYTIQLQRIFKFITKTKQQEHNLKILCILLSMFWTTMGNQRPEFDGSFISKI
jgi:hypothetical protein